MTTMTLHPGNTFPPGPGVETLDELAWAIDRDGIARHEATVSRLANWARALGLDSVLVDVLADPGGVLFKFSNAGPIASSITDIYFDLPDTPLFTLPVDFDFTYSGRLDPQGLEEAIDDGRAGQRLQGSLNRA